MVNKWYYFHTIIFLAITFLFGRLEPIAPLTPLGMNTIGVFLGVIYAWIFIDIIWPAMVGLLALMTLNVLPYETLMNKSFGDPTLVMMIFIFCFSAVLDRYGVSKFISFWFVSRKCIAHRPWLLSFALLFSIALLGGLTSATPATIIGWGLLYGIFELCGYEKKEGYPIMMIIGTVFAAQLGMAMIPFKGLPLVGISAFEKLSGISIDYAFYLSVSVTTCLLCLILFIIVGKYMFRPDLKKLITLDIHAVIKPSDLMLDGLQKTLLWFLFALIAFMMLPSFLPNDLTVTIFFKKIGTAGICILLVAVICALRIKGKPLMSFRDMVHEGVSWPIIFILAFTLPLSGPISSPESGITAFMLQLLDPIFGAHSNMIFVICIGLVAVLMTQFINNTALVVALMPVIYSYCSTNNFPSEAPVVLVIIACCLAFLTPAASSTAAMLNGSDWVTPKDIWKMTPILIICSLLIAFVVDITMIKIFM